jgi:hypothetical protein
MEWKVDKTTEIKVKELLNQGKEVLDISQILGLNEGAVIAIKYGKHKLK